MCLYGCLSYLMANVLELQVISGKDKLGDRNQKVCFREGIW